VLLWVGRSLESGGEVKQTGPSTTVHVIQQAALVLFVEQGFESVTAEQIAQAAGLSVRTFFRHFPEGKEGVLLLEARRGADLFEQALRRRPPQESAVVAVREAAIASVRALDDPTGAFESFGFAEAMKVFSEVVADRPQLLARMMGERQILADGLVDLVALRMSVDPLVDLRPRLVLHAAHAAITVAWLTAFHNPDLDRDVLLREALAMFEDGVGSAMVLHAVRAVGSESKKVARSRPVRKKADPVPKEAKSTREATMLIDRELVPSDTRNGRGEGKNGY
jgi:AcrR family transcriptional regulator